MRSQANSQIGTHPSGSPTAAICPSLREGSQEGIPLHRGLSEGGSHRVQAIAGSVSLAWQDCSCGGKRGWRCLFFPPGWGCCRILPTSIFQRRRVQRRHTRWCTRSAPGSTGNVCQRASRPATNATSAIRQKIFANGRSRPGNGMWPAGVTSCCQHRARDRRRSVSRSAEHLGRSPSPGRCRL